MRQHILFFCKNLPIRHLSRRPYPHSVAETCGWLQQRFDKYAIPEAKISAELIVASAIGQNTLWNVSHNHQLTDKQLLRIKNMAGLRLNRCPVQYVLGEWQFCDLTLYMRPPVFIPRPETETFMAFHSSAELIRGAELSKRSNQPQSVCSGLEECRLEGHERTVFDKLDWLIISLELVNHVSDELTQMDAADVNVLDLCCGSGAVGISLTHKHPNVRCVSVDKSQEACDLTVHNARHIGVADRVTVRNISIGDAGWYQQLSEYSPFDLIVSNPPYVNSKEMEDLQDEISRYEDLSALHGGTDGMDVIQHILDTAEFLLKYDSSIWLEVGDDQPELMKAYMKTQRLNLTYIASHQDFLDRQRFCHLKSSAT